MSLANEILGIVRKYCDDQQLEKIARLVNQYNSTFIEYNMRKELLSSGGIQEFIESTANKYNFRVADFSPRDRRKLEVILQILGE